MSNAPFEATVSVGNRLFRWDPSAGIDLSIPVDFGAQAPEAFGLPAPRVEPLSFGAVSCSTVHDLNPHTTTHIEGPRHAGIDATPIARLLDRSHFLARVVSLRPIPRTNSDRVIERSQIDEALDAGDANDVHGSREPHDQREPHDPHDPRDPFLEAVIIRTAEPDASGGPFRRWTHTNPPYLDPDAARALGEIGVRVLLIDLPSIDREDDGGVPAHRAFFQTGAPGDPRAICELLHIPERVEDGRYLLQLVPLAWDLDASPIRPLLFRLTSEERRTWA